MENIIDERIAEGEKLLQEREDIVRHVETAWDKSNQLQVLALLSLEAVFQELGVLQDTSTVRQNNNETFEEGTSGPAFKADQHGETDHVAATHATSVAQPVDPVNTLLQELRKRADEVDRVEANFQPILGRV